MRAICHERPGCRCPWSAKSDLREFASDFGRTGAAALCFYGVPCAGRAQPRPLIRGFIPCSGRAQPRPLSAALLFKLPVACGQPRSESVNMKTSAVNHAYVLHARGPESSLRPASACRPRAPPVRHAVAGSAAARLGRSHGACAQVARAVASGHVATRRSRPSPDVTTRASRHLTASQEGRVQPALSPDRPHSVVQHVVTLALLYR